MSNSPSCKVKVLAHVILFVINFWERVILFYRTSADGLKTDCTESLSNVYSGTTPAACFIVGAAPSLNDLSEETLRAIQDSPLPKLAMNYAGRGKDGEGYLIKPDIFTTYDPSASFCKSIFLDPTIKKFVRSSRYRDLVSDTSDKMCDMPNVHFFDSGYRSYSDFFGQQHENINDSRDSFIQLLDIGFRLGFRKFYCVGTEFKVSPSKEQVRAATDAGVTYENGKVLRHMPDKKDIWTDLFSAFLDECTDMGVAGNRKDTAELLQTVAREKQYSFSEEKHILAAISSDQHYFQIVQYLRLARKNMTLQGIQLISCTETSRLVPWFPYVSPEDAISNEKCFDVEGELTAGMYCGGSVKMELPYHTDIKPNNWGEYLKQQQKKEDKDVPKKDEPEAIPVEPAQRYAGKDDARLKGEIARLQEAVPVIKEEA